MESVAFDPEAMKGETVVAEVAKQASRLERPRASANRANADDALCLQIHPRVLVKSNAAVIVSRAVALQHRDYQRPELRAEREEGRDGALLMLAHCQARPREHEGFAHPVLRGNPLEVSDPLEPPDLRDVFGLRREPASMKAQLGESA